MKTFKIFHPIYQKYLSNGEIYKVEKTLAKLFANSNMHVETAIESRINFKIRYAKLMYETQKNCLETLVNDLKKRQLRDKAGISIEFFVQNQAFMKIHTKKI